MGMTDHSDTKICEGAGNRHPMPTAENVTR